MSVKIIYLHSKYSHKTQINVYNWYYLGDNRKNAKSLSKQINHMKEPRSVLKRFKIF